MRRFSSVLLGFALLTTPVVAFADNDVPFDSLPPPVQSTVKREVKGGQITEIEYKTKHGKPLYEVEFYDQGAKFEIHVAPDGTLLLRKYD